MIVLWCTIDTSSTKNKLDVLDQNSNKLSVAVEKWMWQQIRVKSCPLNIIYISTGDRWRPMLFVDSAAFASPDSMACYTRVMLRAQLFTVKASSFIAGNVGMLGIFPLETGRFVHAHKLLGSLSSRT